MADVSVIIPARNAAATLPATLDGLAAQRFDGSFEVIVVDSGSSDATQAIAQDHPACTRLLHNPGGEPAGSRNLGAQSATGRLLAFTDADCVPEPGWIAAGRDAALHADLVQGRVSPAPPGLASPFDRSLWVEGASPLFETANLFVDAEWFRRLGGFEPVAATSTGALVVGSGALEQESRTAGAGNLRPFGEDVWFGWRAVRGGARTAFAPDAHVRHAVFPRGWTEYVREAARRRYFPPLVGIVPELRSAWLYRGVFLSPRSAAFDLAAACVVAAAVARSPWPLLGTLPWAAMVSRRALRGGRRRVLAVLAADAASDAVTAAALVRGSLRSRTPVL